MNMTQKKNHQIYRQLKKRATEDSCNFKRPPDVLRQTCLTQERKETLKGYSLLSSAYLVYSSQDRKGRLSMGLYLHQGTGITAQTHPDHQTIEHDQLLQSRSQVHRSRSSDRILKPRSQNPLKHDHKIKGAPQKLENDSSPSNMSQKRRELGCRMTKVSVSTTDHELIDYGATLLCDKLEEHWSSANQVARSCIP